MLQFIFLELHTINHSAANYLYLKKEYELSVVFVNALLLDLKADVGANSNGVKQRSSVLKKIRLRASILVNIRPVGGIQVHDVVIELRSPCFIFFSIYHIETTYSKLHKNIFKINNSLYPDIIESLS